MAEDIRERTTLPFGVPLGIFAVVAFVVFLFSRILLNVPRQVAVAVALGSETFPAASSARTA